MTSVTPTTDRPYGIASGIVDPQRARKRRTACPRCGCDLQGGPVTYWCASSHAFTAADLEEAAERRVHRACERRAAELELERATHVPEYRERA